MTSGATTDRVNCWVAVVPILSVTCTVKVAVVALVGVRVMAPLFASKLNPSGKLPETMDHAYGGAPPVAARV
jgi:hypothetical protein